LKLSQWHRLGWLLPWLALAVSLTVTYLVWSSEQQNVKKDLQADFDFRVREIHSRLEGRLMAYEQILRGTGALFLSSNKVTSPEFSAYIESLHLEDNYPGTHTIGYASVVSPGVAPSDAERGLRTSVSYLSPLLGEEQFSLGSDMYSEPMRRTAMEQARDTGKAANSGKVLLPLYAEEDAHIQSGFLMFVPVYKKGVSLATVEERRANLTGWVYASFRMADLMSDIIGDIAAEVDIEIHDGRVIANDTMMYDPDISGAGGNPKAVFRDTAVLEVAGHEWTVVVVSLYGFEILADSTKPRIVAYIGVLMSLLLAMLAWMLVQGRARAVHAAEAINRELTERKRAEEGLRLADTVVKTVEEGVLVTDHDNLIVAVNPAFTTITGYTAEEVLGKNPRIFSSGRHPKEYYMQMWETLLSIGSWRGEISSRRKNGAIFIEGLSINLVRDEEGRVTHHVGIFSDISERKAAEERIQYMAHHDALTNLPNRALFSDRLQQGLAQAKRDKTRLAVMFLDLDKFKPVNDTYGHAVGDQLLKEVATRLQKCMRESDTVSRIGGDEFVVLLPTIEVELDAMRVAEKILHVLNQPFELAGHSLHISGSIGIAVYPEHGGDEISLAHSADTAMYHAKSEGRNKAQLYGPEMQSFSQ
jgi:diguanylate cyclase (GGDEF)-like protein/PAS domain S-box-containing protein